MQRLGARRLVLAGLAANNCVLASATDASMRGYQIHRAGRRSLQRA